MDPTEYISQRISRSTPCRFRQLTAKSRCALQWPPLSREKLPLRIGDLDPRLIHGTLGPLESTAQTMSQSIQRFCRVRDCNRPTDRPRYSVCNNRPHLLRYTVRRCGLIMAALLSRCGHYIFVLFLLSSFSYFSCLISAVADWLSSILLYMVGLSANLKCRSEM